MATKLLWATWPLVISLPGGAAFWDDLKFLQPFPRGHNSGTIVKRVIVSQGLPEYALAKLPQMQDLVKRIY